jgi:hypothetical protein
MAQNEEPPAPVERRLRFFFRSQRFPLSAVVFGAGVLLSILALGDFTPLSQVGVFTAINRATDTPGANYNLVFVVVGPIVSIVGAYLVGAYVVARRKFEHLMRTKSKAEFLRNVPEVESILWDLTPKDESRYFQKKADLRIRR